MSRVFKLGPPFEPEILNTLERKVTHWSGEAWRLVLEGSDPLAANTRGARWNSPECEALYFSLDPRAANAELDYLLSRQPVPIRKKRELYRFEVQLSKVLDLRLGHDLEPFGISTDALLQEDWAIPQALGMASYNYLECSGVLAPSARFEAVNLVLFLGGMAREDELSSPVPTSNSPVEHD